jgi:hypothetical protein
MRALGGPRGSHERERAVSPVLGAQEDLRAPVLMNVVEPRLLDDAHDGDRLIVEWNLRAERAAGRKELSRDGAIDQRFADPFVTDEIE